MATSSVPTIDFSPAKRQLSDVMTQVFHGHQPRIVSRHHGKEQMLLMRPDDLVAMLGEHRLDVQFFREPARFMATSRGMQATALLRFALADEDEQRRMLGVEQPEPEVAAVGVR